MSPETARMFMAGGICLLIGAGAGAYLTRVVFGAEPANVKPAPDRPAICAPCPTCPACPPPPDCGELGVIPQEQDDPTMVSDGPVEAEDTGPGLPATAIPLAQEAVRAEVTECSDNLDGASGVMILSLTVSSSGTGDGFIREVGVGANTGDLDVAVLDCVRDAAQRARFEWKGQEGTLKFKLPVKIE